VAVHGLPACRAGAGAGDGELREGVTPPPIEEVLRTNTPGWMAVPGVVGTGIGVCDAVPCLKVFVAERTPEIREQIPRSVEGYPILVEVTGGFRAR
jgi:hypothetical protein